MVCLKCGHGLRSLTRAGLKCEKCGTPHLTTLYGIIDGRRGIWVERVGYTMAAMMFFAMGLDEAFHGSPISAFLLLVGSPLALTIWFIKSMG